MFYAVPSLLPRLALLLLLMPLLLVLPTEIKDLEFGRHKVEQAWRKNSLLEMERTKQLRILAGPPELSDEIWVCEGPRHQDSRGKQASWQSSLGNPNHWRRSPGLWVDGLEETPLT